MYPRDDDDDGKDFPGGGCGWGPDFSDRDSQQGHSEYRPRDRRTHIHHDGQTVDVSALMEQAVQGGQLQPPLPPAQTFDEKMARNKAGADEMLAIASGQTPGNLAVPGMPTLHARALDMDGMEADRADPRKSQRIDSFRSVEDARLFCTRELESRGVAYDVANVGERGRDLVTVNWYSFHWNPTNNNVYGHELGDVPVLQVAPGV